MSEGLILPARGASRDDCIYGPKKPLGPGSRMHGAQVPPFGLPPLLPFHL